jgi:hypothetical protein
MRFAHLELERPRLSGELAASGSSAQANNLDA